MAEIKIVMPGKDKPGFLRRQRESLKIQQNLRANPTIEAFDESINWIIRTAVSIKVEDGNDPFDALLDLSEDELDTLMESVRGGAHVVDPQNGG